MVGTQKMGHTYPGATVPFGMVQLSPDTDTISYELNGKYNPDIYKYCAGYNYDDKTIVGFSHTHFSGTGHSDLGDFLLMPTTGPLLLNPGTADHPERGYRSALGIPRVHKAVLHIENGQSFTSQVKNQSAKNGCVQQVTGNGQKLTQPFLAQQDVAKGGALVFVEGERSARK